MHTQTLYDAVPGINRNIMEFKVGPRYSESIKRA